jgi:oligopeptide/dipeptide ABC transporter ATP-binding protein
LTVRYHSPGQPPVYAVNGVDVRVKAGETVGILGESGSGKSTLAAAIMRLLPPTAEYSFGEVLFQGRNTLAISECELRKIRGARVAMIPQDPATSLNPVVRVGVQIAEVLRAHSSQRRSERRQTVMTMLREVGFADPERVYGSYPHELSGGQRQRVVIAQAMICRPALVIADEPTSNLDASLQHEVLALMADLVCRRNASLLLITHDAGILAGLADRIVVLYAGSIVEDGVSGQVLSKPLHPYTQSLLALLATDTPAERIQRFPAISGEPPDVTQLGAGCRFEPRCGDRMAVCSSHEPQPIPARTSQRVSCFKYVE